MVLTTWQVGCSSILENLPQFLCVGLVCVVCLFLWSQPLSKTLGSGALCGPDHLSLDFSFLLSLMVVLNDTGFIIFLLQKLSCTSQTHPHGTDDKDKLIIKVTIICRAGQTWQTCNLSESDSFGAVLDCSHTQPQLVVMIWFHNCTNTYLVREV